MRGGITGARDVGQSASSAERTRSSNTPAQQARVVGVAADPADRTTRAGARRRHELRARDQQIRRTDRAIEVRVGPGLEGHDLVVVGLPALPADARRPFARERHAVGVEHLDLDCAHRHAMLDRARLERSELQRERDAQRGSIPVDQAQRVASGARFLRQLEGARDRRGLRRDAGEPRSARTAWCGSRRTRVLPATRGRRRCPARKTDRGRVPGRAARPAARARDPLAACRRCARSRVADAPRVA